MKKALIFLLTLSLTLTLFGCSEKYEPVESTAEEAKVVMTVNVDGEEYGIRYELYRALFLANRDTVDGGDASVWSSEAKSTYVDRINKIILSHAAEIYGALHLSEELGFDPYSSEIEETISETVKGAVEGDSMQPGHGSYEEYLASLKESGLNYSVATLLMRYSLALDYINEYYYGELDVLGQSSAKFEVKEEDVRSYYLGDGSARILQVYFPAGVKTRSEAESFREALIAIGDTYKMAAYIIGNTGATETDLLVNDKVSGIVIGRNSLRELYYTDFSDSIFALEEGEMSGVIELENTDADGLYIIYRLPKDESHLENCYDAIAESYLDDVIGAALGSVIDQLVESVQYTSDYDSLIHASISMD